MEKIENIEVKKADLTIRSFVNCDKNSFNLANFIDFLEKSKIDNLNIYTDVKNVFEIGVNIKKRLEIISGQMVEFLSVFTSVFQNFYENVGIEERHIDRVIDEIYVLGEKVVLLSKDNMGTLNTYSELFDYLNVCLWGLNKILGELFLIQTVKNNLENKDVHIFGQKIYDKFGDVWETEILTRMTNCRGELVTPNEFLKVVHANIDTKSYGLVHKLDWAVIERSFEYVSQLEDKEVFSINVNHITLKETNFILGIKNLLNKYDVNPSRIVFEILEYTNVYDPENLNLIFAELKKMGFKIAIDDYPEGYNTLNQLLKLENVDIVKLDGKFVMNTFNNCVKCEDMKGCINIHSKTLDLKDICITNPEEDYNLETFMNSLKFIRILYPDIRIFAENVENEKVYDFLVATNMVDGFQGYYEELGKPSMLSKGLRKKTRQEELHDILNFSIKRNHPEETADIESFFDNMKNNVYIEDIVEDHFSQLFIEYFVSFLNLMKLDKISIYVRKPDSILVKTIRDNYSGEKKYIDYFEGKQRVPKEFSNLYRLLLKRPNMNMSGFNISEGGVVEEGDDICVQVNSHIILGFDEEAYAKNNFTDMQRYLMIKLAKFIRGL